MMEQERQRRLTDLRRAGLVVAFFVLLVVGGSGTLTVTRDGQSTTLPISGAPQAHQIVAGDCLAGHRSLKVENGMALKVHPTGSRQRPQVGKHNVRVGLSVARGLC